MVAVFTEALDSNIHVQSCTLVNHTERNRSGSTILVAHDFLCINIVDSLIFSRLSTKSDAPTNALERLDNSFSKFSREN